MAAKKATKKTTGKPKLIKDYIYIFKVGDRDRPAGEEDLKDVADKVAALEAEHNIKLISIVSHHALTVEQVRLHDNFLGV
jgi:hypothetical protein